MIGEPGRERAECGIEVHREIGVGVHNPPVVACPAGREGRSAHGQRVQRVGRLPGAARHEVADGAFPRVVVHRRAGHQRGDGPDQRHPGAQFGHVSGPVVIGREYRLPDGRHHRQIGWDLVEQGADGGDLGVERTPQHIRLRVEVAEERPPADPRLGSYLVDRCFLESLGREQS